MDVASMLFGALALAVAANLAQFWTVNARVPKNYRSFARYANADLIYLGKKNAPHFRRRHGRALAFGDAIDPGASVIVPTDRTQLDDELAPQLLSFGRAADVRRIPYDPVQLGKRLRIKKHVLSKVDANVRQRRPFWIVGRGREAREFAFLRHADTDLLVDTSLLPQAVKRGLAL